MDALKKFLSWLNTLPIWLRAITLALIAGLALIASMTVSACGSTRAVVHNGAHGTTTEIKITTNNPTSVDVSPNVKFNNPQKQ